MVSKLKEMSKIDFLKIMKRLNKNERPTVIKYLDENGTNILCECVKSGKMLEKMK